jgi:hypothetical protein
MNPDETTRDEKTFREKWNIVTLYTVAERDVPTLVQGTYVNMPWGYQSLETDFSMSTVVKKAEMGLYATSAVEAWDLYMAEQAREQSRHQKHVDDCRRRLNWAYAQRQKSKLGAQ